MKHKITYGGDGSNKEFYFDWIYFQDADIQVMVDEVLLLANEYSIMQKPDPVQYESPEQQAANEPFDLAINGGMIVLKTAPAIGSRVDIFRQISLGRTISYQATSKIYPEHINTDLQFITEYLKDMNELGMTLADFQILVNKMEELCSEIPDINFVTQQEFDQVCSQISGITNQLQDVAAAIGANADAIAELISASSGPEDTDTVIETYRAPDGFSWCRKYKSGWTEQGGRVSVPVSGGTAVLVNIPLVAPMEDTGYSLQVFGFSRDATASVVAEIVPNFAGFTTGTAGVRVRHTNAFVGIWEVKGFRAI